MGHPLLFDDRYFADAELASGPHAGHFEMGMAGRSPVHKRLLERTSLRRCALHCDSMTFLHPSTVQPLTVTAPWPQDIREAAGLIQAQQHSNSGGGGGGGGGVS